MLEYRSVSGFYNWVVPRVSDLAMEINVLYPKAVSAYKVAWNMPSRIGVSTIYSVFKQNEHLLPYVRAETPYHELDFEM